jgi:hypothetical protein
MVDRMNGPQTLAEVVKGDTVIEFCANRWSAHTFKRLIVERATKTRVTLSNGRSYTRNSKYSYKDGKEGGQRYSNYRIDVGPEAETKIIELTHELKKESGGREWLAVKPKNFKKGSVADIRAACDRAEAALRELGEWNDEP